MINVLVVDDEEPFRRLLKKELGRKGFSVEVASDGNGALQLLRDHSFDVILLDVVMPEKNGFQVCRDLKRDARYQHIPVILTTSKSGDSDKFWGKKQGADEYITKPFEPVDILLAVKRQLGGSK